MSDEAITGPEFPDNCPGCGADLALFSKIETDENGNELLVCTNCSKVIDGPL